MRVSLLFPAELHWQGFGRGNMQGKGLNMIVKKIWVVRWSVRIELRSQGVEEKFQNTIQFVNLHYELKIILSFQKTRPESFTHNSTCILYSQ